MGCKEKIVSPRAGPRHDGYSLRRLRASILKRDMRKRARWAAMARVAVSLQGRKLESGGCLRCRYVRRRGD